MAASSSFIERLDAQLASLFADWNIYTTLICGLLVLYVAYPVFFSREPDLHPFLLARQSSPSYVRQPGESAVYRSLETPHGYPLRKGLNVKDPEAPKWTSGRDGNLRDIWQQAVRGPAASGGDRVGSNGTLHTVLGKEEVISHQWEKLTKDLNALGQHLRDHGGKRIAIYLPNSVETIVSLFASALYGLTPILLPYERDVGDLVKMLDDSKADYLVASAGSVPLTKLLNQYSGLRQVIWVAELSSRHMDWNEVPEGVGGKAEIAVWHEIIDEKTATNSSELPSSIEDDSLPHIVIVTETPGEIGFSTVTFAQSNLAAAVAAQQSALPRNQRLESRDLVLPLAPLANSYTLVTALTALFSNASLALMSVTNSSVDYAAAFRGITPTVVIATPLTLLKLWNDRRASSKGLLEKLSYARKARVLAGGNMPKAASGPRAPRLIFTYASSSQSSTQLTSAQIFDLRIFTNAHIASAFTDNFVAGAISQTNVYDYGYSIDHGDRPSHFGPPLSCVEIKLIDSPDGKITDGSDSAGWLVVEGPAVVDSQTTMSVDENKIYGILADPSFAQTN